MQPVGERRDIAYRLRVCITQKSVCTSDSSDGEYFVFDKILCVCTLRLEALYNQYHHDNEIKMLQN